MLSEETKKRLLDKAYEVGRDTKDGELISLILECFEELEKAHTNMKQNFMVVFLTLLIFLYVISGLYVLSTQVTAQNLEKKVIEIIQKHDAISI